MSKLEIITNRSLLVREIFYFLTALGLVFIALEIIWPNIVLAYFNLNYLLLLWLIFGLVMLFRKK